MTSIEQGAAEGSRPTLRVISGPATAEEIAAVLAVVAARSGGGASAAAGAEADLAQTWSAHGYAHRHIRATFSRSPHGWKTSYWPR